MKLVNELDEDVEEAVLNIYVFMNKNDEYIDIEKDKKICDEVVERLKQ